MAGLCRIAVRGSNCIAFLGADTIQIGNAGKGNDEFPL